jgi:hypothetical protein
MQKYKSKGKDRRLKSRIRPLFWVEDGKKWGVLQ